MQDNLLIIAIICAGLSLGFLIGAVAAGRKGRALGSAFCVGVTLLLLSVSTVVRSPTPAS